MSRKRQQAELIFALGQFFGPLLKVADNPGGFDEDEKTRIFARFFHDQEEYQRRIRQYSLGEPGHNYAIQHVKMFNKVNLIKERATRGAVSEADLLQLVKDAASQVTETLLSIPVPVDSTIYEAQTPFSTYCFVKELCTTVKTKIVWLDRYFDQTVFHRFFVDTPPSVPITLVTLPPSAAKGKADAQRIAEFLDVSRIFAVERGCAGYQLLANDSFHDRWLQCDEKLFTLGGSIKDLAKPFTISKLDYTTENRQQFDDAVLNGLELFGPTQPQHP